MYSAVILTLNEEKALPGCLSSLRGCDDVVVLDSGSSDATVRIARDAGARVVTRPFDSFAGQRNFAQREVAFAHPWVFHLDADERMTPELDGECRRAVALPGLDGFRVAPRMIFEGRWIRHCTDYPAYQARLVRAPAFEFIQVGHGQRESPAMRLANLSAGYLHDISIYGREAWLEKHRRYARQEAREFCDNRSASPRPSLLSADPLVRRRALKRMSGGLPARPLLRFTYQYFLRLGLLDGAQGFRYCLLLARYEAFIAQEIARLRNPAQS